MSLKRIRKDQRGSAAVEFALIAPVAILLYCGFAELTMAMMAERRAAHAASVVADLVTQNTQLHFADIDDMYTIGSSIMHPFPAGPLKLRISSVTADANAVPQMTWSRGYGGFGPLPAGKVTGFPANLLVAGDSVVEADVQYAFTSPLKMVLPNGLTFKTSFYLRPRRSPSVTLLP
jgi:Flp pilus assembly protein TadG